MAIEVFSRYEKKYLLNKATYENLLNRLKEKMYDDPNSKDEFYTICNLYYDTPTNELIRKSIEKPVYKEKLRLRSYGVPGLEEKVYLELKKKYKGVVYKRRIVLPLQDAYTFLENKEIPQNKGINSQIAREVQYFLEMYPLEPKVYLSYERKALFAKEEKELRITFDKNIITRRNDLKLEKGNLGEKLLREGYVLMEIKAPMAMPLWLCDIISELKIYPVSFSKYGNEYKKKIIQEGELECLNQYLQLERILSYPSRQQSLVS
jgi:SPX domain protein involved in polyphosphate accumulation